MVKNVNELMKGRGAPKRKGRKHLYEVGTTFKFGKNHQTYIKSPSGKNR